ncbi:MAG: epimerase [Gemmatimonadota bacterium]
MNVVLFGATGMVGSGVLLECLDDPRVASVLVVGRRSCGVTHPKLTEVLHDDFFDYSALGPHLSGLDACFFCLGVSAAGMNEAEYTRLTHDLTLAAARALLDRNPDMVFCYVSGLGTDSTESGRAMWARVKGRTENALLAMPFRGAYMFRPGFIQPLRGVRSRTRLYAALYRVAGPFFPLLRRLFPRQVTTSVRVGRAMIRVAAEGYASPILESHVIDGLGAG